MVVTTRSSLMSFSRSRLRSAVMSIFTRPPPRSRQHRPRRARRSLVGLVGIVRTARAVELDLDQGPDDLGQQQDTLLPVHLEHDLEVVAAQHPARHGAVREIGRDQATAVAAPVPRLGRAAGRHRGWRPPGRTHHPAGPDRSARRRRARRTPLGRRGDVVQGDAVVGVGGAVDEHANHAALAGRGDADVLQVMAGRGDDRGEELDQAGSGRAHGLTSLVCSCRAVRAQSLAVGLVT